MRLTKLDKELLCLFYKKKGHMIFKTASDGKRIRIHILTTYSDKSIEISRDKLLFYKYINYIKGVGFSNTMGGRWIVFRNGI